MTSEPLPAQSKKVQKDFQKAETAYFKRDFSEADKWISKVLEQDAVYTKAYLLLATMAVEQKKNNEAIRNYRKVLSLDSVHYSRAFYLLGKLCFDQGLYHDASKYLRSYVNTYRGSAIPEKVQHLLASATFAAHAEQHPVVDSVTPLPSVFNTSDNEYINFVDAGQCRIIFTRKVLLRNDAQQRPVYRDEVFVSRKQNGAWVTPQRMHFPWPESLNMGGVSFSPDGHMLYFTGCHWPNGRGSCDLYQSRRKDTTWQKPQPMGYNINTSRWESQGVVSSDNRLLIFASRRPGGKGGSDLWMSVRQKNGQWGKPVDMGDSINTSGNEMAPFLHPDNRTLYFASNGRTGMGGYDLYYSRKRKDGSWSKAKNLGFPVNTKWNEISLFITPDGKRAWLSSDREHEGNFDLYTFVPESSMKPKPVVLFSGVVLDSRNRQPLQAKLVLSQLPDGRVTDSLYSGSDGHFLLAVPVGSNVALHVVKSGYLFYSQHLEVQKAPAFTTKQMTILLSPVVSGNKIQLNNVYFEFDKAVLQKAADAELNRMVDLMRQNPKVKIQINGYTDNVGSTAYNLKLSEARAKAVYEYLVNHGIQASRMSYKGYGNTKPVGDNSTAAGRAVNRRTEVVIR